MLKAFIERIKSLPNADALDDRKTFSCEKEVEQKEKESVHKPVINWTCLPFSPSFLAEQWWRQVIVVGSAAFGWVGLKSGWSLSVLKRWCECQSVSWAAPGRWRWALFEEPSGSLQEQDPYKMPSDPAWQFLVSNVSRPCTLLLSSSASSSVHPKVDTGT